MKILLFAAAFGLAAGYQAGSAPAGQAAPPASPAQPAPAPPATPTAQPTPSAAPLPDADPALWVVRDTDTTVYLFGTFHLLDGRPWFNDEVRTAFDASDELVLEAIIPENPASLAPLIQSYAIDRSGRKLPDRLSAGDRAALVRALAPLGAPANAFDSFKPWFVSLTLTVTAAQRLGISSNNGPETILSQAARARQMRIGELEGMEWQIRLFDSMTDEQQMEQLRETLRNLDRMPRTLAPMLAAWSEGDVNQLRRIVNASGGDSPAIHRLIYTNRNANWARWIRERMARPGTVFIAVGAAHLAGTDNVQSQLRRLGFRATRVPHVETAH